MCGIFSSLMLPLLSYYYLTQSSIVLSSVVYDDSKPAYVSNFALYQNVFFSVSAYFLYFYIFVSATFLHYYCALINPDSLIRW